MRPARHALLCSLLAGLLSCTSPPLPDGLPALIINPDDDSRRELRQVLTAALGQDNITLADDALTTTSLLSFEPGAPRGINAPPANGRLLGRPEVFRLLLDGPQCVLVHERTGLRWLLLDTECAAE
jgi:hypothetical protein